MKNKFSKTWESSKQPRKQKKFLANAPLHTKSRLLGVNLSKELRTKYGRRNITIRKGDKVKVLRGKTKGKVGKIDRVSIKKSRVYVEGIDVVKKDGTKRLVPIHPSNLSILELRLDDKKRVQSLEKKKEGEKKDG